VAYDHLAIEGWWHVVEVPVQVNGKVRGRLRLARDASADDARAAVLASDDIGPCLEGQTVRKFVYVPGKIVNLVVG
jgi:leucyl-tRNA synthetase